MTHDFPYYSPQIHQPEISTLDSTTFKIVQEYCRLSKLESPSEGDLNRITAILELAQFDPELSCLINEADHLIAYEMGLCEARPSIDSRIAALLHN